VRSVLFRAAVLVAWVGLLACPAQALERAGRGWLGVEMRLFFAGGVFVEHVFAGSPAARAQLAPGDRLLRADGLPIGEPADLVAHVGGLHPGARLELEIVRADRRQVVHAVLDRHPGELEVTRLKWIGKRAPELEIEDGARVQGQLPARLGDLGGRVVVLAIWTSGCTSCRALAPTLSELDGRWRKRGLSVLGVGVDDRAALERALRGWRAGFAVAADPDRSATRLFDVPGTLGLFVIDRNGVIVELLMSYESGRRAALEKLLERLLGEGPTP
jgi:thiol-disulfide isomerase/thioredoxin